MSERKPRIGILGIMQDLYDDMIPGCYDPKERIKDMDLDGALQGDHACIGVDQHVGDLGAVQRFGDLREGVRGREDLHAGHGYALPKK